MKDELVSNETEVFLLNLIHKCKLLTTDVLQDDNLFAEIVKRRKSCEVANFIFSLKVELKYERIKSQATSIDVQLTSSSSSVRLIR